MSIIRKTSVSFLLLLSGCAAGPYESSKLITIDKAVTITPAVTYMINDSTVYTLLAGRYQGAREDAQGIYYVGPRGCYRTKLVKSSWATGDHLLNKTMASDCGIYVPNNLEMPVKIFTILHGTNSSWEVQENPTNIVDPKSTDSGAHLQISLQENASANIPGTSVGQAALGTGIALSLGESLMKSTEVHYLFLFSPPPKEVQIRKHITE